MTKAIGLVAGSGSGKSTTAAQLFSALKLKGYNVELVREYVKAWAWKGIKPTAIDQLYLIGKQSHYESQLYGKVDFIITDCPVIISGFFENYFSGGKQTYVTQAMLGFLEHAKSLGVDHHNFFIQRTKPFQTKGRYETEEEAKNIDKLMLQYMDDHKIPYTMVHSDGAEDFDQKRPDVILSHFGIH